MSPKSKEPKPTEISEMTMDGFMETVISASIAIGHLPDSVDDLLQEIAENEHAFINKKGKDNERRRASAEYRLGQIIALKSFFVELAEEDESHPKRSIGFGFSQEL